MTDFFASITMKDFFGSLTLVLAMAMTLFAIPSQVLKNFKDKRCELSFLMIFLPLSVYASRICYSITIRSWYILIPDSLGLVSVVVLMWQFFAYRKKQQ